MINDWSVIDFYSNHMCDECVLDNKYVDENYVYKSWGTHWYLCC